MLSWFVVALSLALVTISFACFATAQTSVRWATDEWHDFTRSDGTGLYHELMQAVFPATDYRIDVKYMSWPRVMQAISKQNADMTGALPPEGRFYYSENPVLTETLFLIGCKDNIDALPEGALKTLSVSWRRGYRDTIATHANITNIKGIDVDSAENALALIQKGRLDYFIDIHSIISKLPVELKQGLATRNVGAYPLHWAFARNAKGRSLKAQFDKRFAELRSNGQLQAMYRHHGIILPQR